MLRQVLIGDYEIRQADTDKGELLTWIIINKGERKGEGLELGVLTLPKFVELVDRFYKEEF